MHFTESTSGTKRKTSQSSQRFSPQSKFLEPRMSLTSTPSPKNPVQHPLWPSFLGVIGGCMRLSLPPACPCWTPCHKRQSRRFKSTPGAVGSLPWNQIGPPLSYWDTCQGHRFSATHRPSACQHTRESLQKSLQTSFLPRRSTWGSPHGGLDSGFPCT